MCLEVFQSLNLGNMLVKTTSERTQATRPIQTTALWDSSLVYAKQGCIYINLIVVQYIKSAK